MAETAARIILTARDETREAFASVDRGLNKISGAMATFGVALSGAAFANFIKGSIDTADRLNDLSKITGTSVATLSGLRLAAEQSGTSLEAVASASAKLSKTLEANPEAFRAVGVTAKDSTGAMIQLADVFAGMPDGIEKVALAQKVFGRSGADMIPILNEGSDGLRALIEQGQQLNPITAEMAAQADAFKDSMDALSASAAGVGVSMASKLLEPLNIVAQEMLAAEKNTGALALAGDAVAETFKTLVVLVANAAFVFKQVGSELGGLAAQFVAFASGDFKGASAIGDMMKADAAIARAEIDRFSASVMSGHAKIAAATAKSDGGVSGAQLKGGLSGDGAAAAEQQERAYKSLMKVINDKLAVSNLDLVTTEKLTEGQKLSAKVMQELHDVTLKLSDPEKIRVTAGLESLMLNEKTLSDQALLAESYQAQIDSVNNLAVAVYDASKTSEQVEIESFNARLLAAQNYRDKISAIDGVADSAEKNARDEHAVYLDSKQQNAYADRIRKDKAAGVSNANLWKSGLEGKMFVLGDFSNRISGLMQTTNRKQFEIGRAAAMSAAVVDTYASAVGAFKAYASIPYVGPVLGAAAAAAAIGMGMANVSKIRSQQFGGGGGSPAAIPTFNASPNTGLPESSASSANLSAPTLPQSSSGNGTARTVNVTLQSDSGMVSTAWIRDTLIPGLNDAVGDGVRLRTA